LNSVLLSFYILHIRTHYGITEMALNHFIFCYHDIFVMTCKSRFCFNIFCSNDFYSSILCFTNFVQTTFVQTTFVQTTFVLTSFVQATFVQTSFVHFLFYSKKSDCLYFIACINISKFRARYIRNCYRQRFLTNNQMP
jgi:hypothetical protein